MIVAYLFNAAQLDNIAILDNTNVRDYFLLNKDFTL